MTIALVIVGGFYAAIALGSAAGKLTKNEQVIASLTGVGVKPSFVPVLAILEILGAAGLVVGIWSKPLGLAAAVCLALYFAGAVIAHLRVRDKAAAVIPPFVLMVIGIATSLLEAHR